MAPNTPERNSPCPCGSGKKYKKCCGFHTARVVEPALPTQEEAKAKIKETLNYQLAKFAPEVTIETVEAKIREVLKNGTNPHPSQVIESVFNDDNLNIKNKRQAERLFRAIMDLWKNIAESEKNQ